MIRAAKIIGTGLVTTGLIGASVTLARIKSTRSFFRTAFHKAADPYDGSDVDRTQEIVDKYGNNKEAIKEYFVIKEQSIRESHRIDSNSAAASGVSSSELHE